MQLIGFSVEGLFGLFDHRINFNTEKRITIIHAPNGFGKTVILKLIAGFFSSSSAIFKHVEFKKIIFFFTEGTSVQIEKHLAAEKAGVGSLSVSLMRKGKSDQSWPNAWSEANGSRREFSPSFVERVVPFLRRVGPTEFEDMRSGEVCLPKTSSAGFAVEKRIGS
jgi:hypothetical protein